MSFAKLNEKVARVAAMLDKRNIVAGTAVILCYSHSIDYVVAMHACLYLGLIAIVITPIDPAHVEEEFPVLQSVISEYSAQLILCNELAMDMLKSRQVQAAVKVTKKSASKLPNVFPEMLLTTNCVKVSKSMEPSVASDNRRRL